MSQVVVRPVMRPIISQSQAAFVRTMQPQTLTQVMTNQAVLQGQQVEVYAMFALHKSSVYCKLKFFVKL